MTARIDVAEVAPEGYQAVLGLERYIRRTIDRTLLHLVKLRASMVNACAFCVDLHSTDALASGESTARLFGLAAWREAGLYSEREMAALALTDSVTTLGQHGVPDHVWDGAATHFSEKELADLLVAIATINVWNRIAVPSRTPPASAAAAVPAGAAGA
jgi:AhpD family alkylhydroperoxidase